MLMSLVDVSTFVLFFKSSRDKDVKPATIAFLLHAFASFVSTQGCEVSLPLAGAAATGAVTVAWMAGWGRGGIDAEGAAEAMRSVT